MVFRSSGLSVIVGLNSQTFVSSNTSEVILDSRQLQGTRCSLFITSLTKSSVMGKSQIKSHEIKSNPNHMNPNQIKSRCQPNDNISRLYSLCAKCHQCTSGLTINVSAKIRDGTITEINSLTQLQ